MAFDQTKSDKDVSAEFTAYYLQRATHEFAEDLDKVRVADDFKNDAISLLVNALQQGTTLFSLEDRRKIVTAEPALEKLSAPVICQVLTSATWVCMRLRCNIGSPKHDPELWLGPSKSGTKRALKRLESE